MSDPSAKRPTSPAHHMPPSVPPGMRLELSRATFRHTDAGGTEWLYHLSLYGEGTSGLDLSNPVDREHYEYALRCKEPGWEELRPVLMLAPRPILPLLEAWGRDGEVTDATGGK